MPITKLDSQSVDHLRGEINQALKAVANKFGLKIQVGAVRYSPTEGNFKVKVNTINANGVVETVARTRFIQLASHYGLDPNWLDQEFIHKGDKYKIEGLNTRASRYKIQVIRIHDKACYKFPASLVRKCMERIAP